jgi:hypothetical protein
VVETKLAEHNIAPVTKIGLHQLSMPHLANLFCHQ